MFPILLKNEINLSTYNRSAARLPSPPNILTVNCSQLKLHIRPLMLPNTDYGKKEWNVLKILLKENLFKFLYHIQTIC